MESSHSGGWGKRIHLRSLWIISYTPRPFQTNQQKLLRSKTHGWCPHSAGFCGEWVVPRPSPLCSPVSRTQMAGQTAYVFVCCIVVEMCLKPYSNAGCQSRRKGLPWPGLARRQDFYLRILIVPTLLVCPQPATFLRAVPWQKKMSTRLSWVALVQA